APNPPRPSPVTMTLPVPGLAPLCTAVMPNWLGAVFAPITPVPATAAVLSTITLPVPALGARTPIWVASTALLTWTVRALALLALVIELSEPINGGSIAPAIVTVTAPAVPVDCAKMPVPPVIWIAPLLTTVTPPVPALVALIPVPPAAPDSVRFAPVVTLTRPEPALSPCALMPVVPNVSVAAAAGELFTVTVPVPAVVALL